MLDRLPLDLADQAAIENRNIGEHQEEREGKVYGTPFPTPDAVRFPLSDHSFHRARQTG